MKKKFKILGGALSVIILLTLVFGAGVYASQWLSFTGDNQIEQSESDVDEIMQILRNVNDGKITAEDAVVKLEARVQELEDMNPSGLAKQNKELREKVDNLESMIALRDHTIEGLEADVADLKEQLANAPEDQTEYVKHLEEQLQIANEAVESLNIKTGGALEEARTYK